MSNRRKRSIIRASEIGTYVYCRRAWWLKRVANVEQRGRQGVLNEGIRAHTKHGKQVQRSQLQRQIALFFFLLGLVLITVAIMVIF